MNALARLSILCLALSLLAGCKNERARTLKILQRSDTRELRHEAARLYKDAFAARGVEIVPISADRWPKPFARFSPRRVSAYPDGLALALTPSAAAEAGLYIIPEGMTHHPAASPRARFDQLAEGIYWYEFGAATGK